MHFSTRQMYTYTNKKRYNCYLILQLFLQLVLKRNINKFLVTNIGAQTRRLQKKEWFSRKYFLKELEFPESKNLMVLLHSLKYIPVKHSFLITIL